MKMPANLRTLGVGKLQDHAKEKFGKELTGTKPELLAQIKELYDSIDNVINEAVQALEKPKDTMASVENFKLYETKPTKVTLDTPTAEPVKVELVPEVIPFQGVSIHKWPDKVKWLLNERTGVRWEATDALRERIHDLVPCTPPLEK